MSRASFPEHLVMFPELKAALTARRASVPIGEPEGGVVVSPEKSGPSIGQPECGEGSLEEELSSSPRAAGAVAPPSVGPNPTPPALAARPLAARGEDAEPDSPESDGLTEAVTEKADPHPEAGRGVDWPVGAPADPLVDREGLGTVPTPSKREAAVVFLRQFLAEAPQRAGCVEAAAKDRSISDRMLRYAKAELGVKSVRTPEGVVWVLPGQDGYPQE